MRDTVFSDLQHAPGRSLSPLVGERLAPYLVDGHSYSLVLDDRTGKVHATLLDLGAGIAVQIWEPEASAPVVAPPAPVQAPALSFPAELDADSDTDTVALWARTQGLADAYVAGAWVWVDDSIGNRLRAGDETGEALRAMLKVNGFDFSRKRSAYFHKCGVRPKGERPTGRKLSAMHNTVPVVDFRPSTYDPRPAWKQRKTRKRRAA